MRLQRHRRQRRPRHVRNTRVSRHATGIYVKSGSDYGTYTGNTLVDNNIENVNTPSPGGDDSGAFGFLIHGDHNLFSAQHGPRVGRPVL